MYQWMAEACGNTFLVLFAVSEQSRGVHLHLDNLRRHGRWSFDTALVLLQASSGAVRMYVLERDGSQSNMCGNGLRAAGCVLDKLGLPRLVTIGSTTVMPVDRVRPGVYEVSLQVELLETRLLSCNEPIFSLYLVSGEPHVVAVVPDIDRVPLARWGKRFTPQANCTIVSKASRTKIIARTYERGGVGITESCGTGACAAAHAVYDLFDSGRTTYEVLMHQHSLHVAIGTRCTYLKGPAVVHSIT